MRENDGRMDRRTNVQSLQCSKFICISLNQIRQLAQDETTGFSWDLEAPRRFIRLYVGQENANSRMKSPPTFLAACTARSTSFEVPSATEVTTLPLPSDVEHPLVKQNYMSFTYWDLQH